MIVDQRIQRKAEDLSDTPPISGGAYAAPPCVPPIDVDTAVCFVRAIHGHERAGFAIVMLKDADKPPIHYGVDLAKPNDGALRRVLKNNAQKDIYLAVALYTRPPAPGMHRKKEMVLHCHWLICEADEHPLPTGMPTPTFIVETSAGRFQFWWRMDHPLTVAQFEDYAERIAVRVGCNLVKDATRVLRVPGTRNRKPGRDGFIVRVVAHNPAALYSITAFDHYPGIARSPGREPPVNRSAPPVDQILAPGVRHTTLLSLAGTVRRRGCDREEILALIATVNTRRCRPPLSEDELDRIAASVCRYPPHDIPWQPRQTSPDAHGSSGWTVGTTRRIAVGEEDPND